jgi:uncharacterized membrane protein
MLSGLLISLPLIILAVIFYFAMKIILGFLTPISFLFFNGGAAGQTPWYIYLCSLLVFAIFLLIIGLVIRNSVGFEYYSRFETGILSRIPLYTSLRDTVGHFSSLRQMPFSQVVLIDAYGAGILLTGFITEQISSDMFTVFVPTAPNPMNGNIYHVPRARIVFLKVRSEVALRTIVSMGTGSSALFAEWQTGHSEYVDPTLVNLDQVNGKNINDRN